MFATPTDAATVMLVRPCQKKDIEILMVLRNRKSRFVPGYYVYPGGILDAEDYEAGMEYFTLGVDRKLSLEILPDMSQAVKALGAWVAGIRETFEEVGILIARQRNGSPLMIKTAEQQKRFSDYRRALNRGEIKFSQILAGEDLILPLDSLYYFSHWITPEALPLRYDVRFFVALAPAGQSVMHDGVELTEHRWLTPAQALEEYERGKMEMVLPQLMTLLDISSFRTVDEVFAAARQRKITATLTKISRINGEDLEVMPDGSVFRGRLPVYSRPEKS